MDEEQIKLDEELAHVIYDLTQSRVSITEALVLIKQLETAGWRVSKIEVKAAVDPFPLNAPLKPAYKAPEVAPTTWHDPRTATDGPAFHQALKSEVTHSEKANARVEGADYTGGE